MSPALRAALARPEPVAEALIDSVELALRLSPDLALPLETVTQAIGVLAKRRAGKSYTAGKLTEELLKAGQQVIVIDPKGDWWGLRSSADGKSPGLPIPILGGEHGDIPLEPQAGEAIARFVVEERISALIDLSAFRKYEVALFMTAFLETLYRLKAKEQFRTPVMLVVDEADAIAPQRPQKGEERMLGAAEDIVRRGGQRGIGCLMATQRAAVLNKNVLTQIQILIALRTIAPQDLAALNDWIDVHGTPEQRRELMASLPSLAVGTAWVWSPGWPEDDGIFQRVQVARRETFDSSATPKPGEERLGPRTLADVDLAVLSEQMAEVVEKAKADDPKELRKQLAEVKHRLESAEATTRLLQVAHDHKPEPERIIERVEVPIVSAGDVETLQRAAQAAQEAAAGLNAAAERVVAALGSAQRATYAAPVVAAPKPPAVTNLARNIPKAIPAGSEAKLSKAERSVLTVLAQYPDGRTKTQIAVLTGYSSGGGGFNNAISACRSRGWLEGTQAHLAITDAGREALGYWEPLPTGAALREYWYGQVGKAERLVLETLARAYPLALTKEQVATETGYAANGGGFNNALSRLRTLELIDGRGELRAADELFEAAV